MSENATMNATLDKKEAAKYLTLYLGNADWNQAINRLFLQLKKKHGSDIAAAMRRTLACAILLPKDDHIKVPSDPTKVLFWATSAANQAQKDWWEALQAEMARDKEIDKNRHIVSTLGVIHPIDYSPVTRQAFNWMYAKGMEVGHIDKSNKHEVEKKLKNLVSIYGGQVVCNLFNMNTRNNPVLDKVVNWYSAYFVERLIYETYSLDNVIKIKKLELEKTNKDLVVKLTAKN